MYLSEDIQELNEDQSSEGNADYVDEGVIEEDDTEEHDHCSLID